MAQTFSSVSQCDRSFTILYFQAERSSNKNAPGNLLGAFLYSFVNVEAISGVINGIF